MNALLATKPKNASKATIVEDPEGKKVPYWPELDGIRTIAFLMVFTFHNGLIPGSGCLTETLYGICSKFFFGVDLFFVLSGFLITYLLLKERKITGTISLKRFYLKRTIRIWPMYFLVLGISAAIYSIGYFFNHGSIDYFKQLFMTYFPFVLFLGNFALIHNNCIICDFSDPFGRICTALISPLWSLCVEEQFYLIWPLIVRKASAKNLLRIAIALSVIALASRIGFWSLSLKDHNFLRYYFNSICCVDALMFGAGLAVIRFHFDEPLRQFGRFILPATLIATVGMIAVFLSGLNLGDNGLKMVFVMTFMPLCMAIFLNAVMKLSELKKLFSSPGLANFGKYTYSAYLLHYGILCAFNEFFLRNFLHLSKFSRFAVIYFGSLAMTILLSLIAWQIIESPLLELRRKLKT